MYVLIFFAVIFLFNDVVFAIFLSYILYVNNQNLCIIVIKGIICANPDLVILMRSIDVY